MATQSNLIMVSNRLPISLKKKDNGEYSYNMSSGGLVSGLSGMTKDTTFHWFGWPGLEVPEGDVDKVTKELEEKYQAVPIWLPDEMADRHCELLHEVWSFIAWKVANKIISRTQIMGSPVSQPRNFSPRPCPNERLKIQFFGPYFTIIPEKLASTRTHGSLIVMQTDYLPKLLPNLLKTAILSGSMIITSCCFLQC